MFASGQHDDVIAVMYVIKCITRTRANTVSITEKKKCGGLNLTQNQTQTQNGFYGRLEVES